MGLFDFIGGPRQEQPQKNSPHQSTIVPSAQVTYLKGDIIAGEYLIEDVFGGAGASGMGVVYLVSHRDYALPFVLKTFQAGPANSDLKQRFLREAELWVKIGIHPNVVQALWAREIDTDIYVAAEFVPKDSLGRNTITDFIPFCPRMLPNVLRWCAEFCYAMKHAQARGIIAHRDIKPDNLMVDPRGRLKVTDFGLVRGTMENSLKDVSFSESSPNADLTMAGSILGTLPFMAPEQFQDSASVDHRADIYAFGIVLYQMLTGGDYPYQMSRKPTNFLQEYFQAHTHGELPSLDSPLFAIVKKSLQKTPNERYASYDSMLSDIFRAAKQLGIALPAPTLSVEESVEELYRQAVTLSQLGKHNEALEKIDKYIRQRPNDCNGWAEKGEILARFDQHMGAVNTAMQQELMEVNPESKEQIDLSRTYEGMECTRKALALYNEDSHCWNNLGVYHSRLGQWKEAVTAFSKAVELDPQNNGAHMQLASAFMFQDKFSRAVDHLLIALTLAPNKKNLLFNAKNHAAFMVRKGAIEEAKAIYEKMAKLNPKDIDAVYNLGLCFLQSDDIENALDIFLKAEKLDNNDQGVWFQLMNIYFKKQNGNKVISYADKLTDSNNYLEEAVNKKSRVLFYTGNTEKAFELLKDTLHKHPTLDFLWFTLSDLYEQTRRYPESLAAIKKCLEILLRSSDTSPEKVKNVKRKLQELESKAKGEPSAIIQEAISNLKNIEKNYFRQKPHIDAIKRLIELCMQEGDSKNAFKYCDVLIENTTYITDFGNKAIVMSYFGDHDGAIRLLQEILTERPHLDSLWFILSGIYEEKGNIEAAFKAAVNCRNILKSSDPPNIENLADVEARINSLRSRMP